MPTCGGCPCEECVCEMDAYCCDTQWDSLCVDECDTQCGGCGSEEPGEFGSPCNDNDDCLSGYCVVMPTGKSLCTKPCMPDCPEGWECEAVDTISPEALFLCMPECTPNCAGKECGDDGCGGQCGYCGDASCVAGVCVGANDGCMVWEYPTCGGCQCEECVCNMDQFCCETMWDDLCVDECMNQCGGCGGGEPGGFGWPCQFAADCLSGHCVPGPLGNTVCTIKCQGECPAGWVCVADQTDPSGKGLCMPGCEPNCWGKECGDDGCGGSCGTCPAWTVCMNNLCYAEDPPDCEGKECGPDGIGGSCGECAWGEVCQMGQCVPQGGGNDGCMAWEFPGCEGCTCQECVCNMDPYCCDTQWDNICVDECQIDCGGCGGGEPGTFGWPCQGNDECLSGYCVTSPQGDQVCTIFCIEDCPEYWKCEGDVSAGDIVFICLPECTAGCEDKECGPDGCGGTCGECPLGFWCKDYQCTDCFPDCMGMMCGSDGCGGSCGECPPGWVCENGSCIQ